MKKPSYQPEIDALAAELRASRGALSVDPVRLILIVRIILYLLWMGWGGDEGWEWAADEAGWEVEP